jgi:hypothetical protein
MLIPDGRGGALIGWTDRRLVYASNAYLQHVLASGTVDAGWPVNGSGVLPEYPWEDSPQIAGDGHGGAFVTWTNYQAAGVSVGHMLVDGRPDPLWNTNNSLSYLPAEDQTIMGDSAGSAMVAWTDARAGLYNSDIYAGRVLGGGVPDPRWPAYGLAVCTAAWEQRVPKIISDGGIGALIVWSDSRDGCCDPRTTLTDIYAQHVLASGEADAAWPVDGQRVSFHGDATYMNCIADGLGGAFVAWAESAGSDVEVQHLMPDASIAAGWPAQGVKLSSDPNAASKPEIVSDQSGGAVVCWLRSPYPWLYAQRVTSAGTVAWHDNGVRVCPLPSTQTDHTIVSDQVGGVVIAWVDTRSGNANVYAQHILASGELDSTWPPNGAPVSTAAGAQTVPASISDGAGGSIIVWQDARDTSNVAFGLDVFAQRIDRYGMLGIEPTILQVCDVPSDHGGEVTLSWAASPLDSAGAQPEVSSYEIYRADRAGAWTRVAAEPATHRLEYNRIVTTGWDSIASTSPRTCFRVRALTSGMMYWDSAPDSGYSVDNLLPRSPGPLEVAPNPSRGPVSVTFALSGESQVDLFICDLQGRRVETLLGGIVGPGEHSTRWTPGAPTAARAQMYFVVMRIDGRTSSRRLVKLK